MASLAEILSDKKTYPDDTKITLAGGAEATLGDLRGGFMRNDDYTRKTQEVARDRESFAREKAEFEQAKTEAEAQLARLAEKAVGKQPTSAGPTDPVEDFLQNDPLARRLVDRIDGLNKKLVEVEARTTEQQKRMEAQAQAYIAEQHRRALHTLKAQDKDLDEQALVSYARENYIPRLDLAYRLYTEERRLKQAVDDAKSEATKAGYEKAKRELAQPQLPQRRVATVMPEDAPKSFDEAADRALRDPEILATLEGRTGA